MTKMHTWEIGEIETDFYISVSTVSGANCRIEFGVDIMRVSLTLEFGIRNNAGWKIFYIDGQAAWDCWGRETRKYNLEHGEDSLT